jgi:hypothetical protein
VFILTIVRINITKKRIKELIPLLQRENIQAMPIKNTILQWALLWIMNNVNLLIKVPFKDITSIMKPVSKR